MLFGYGSGPQQMDGNKTCRQIAGIFDCHADAAVQCGAHRPMEHIQGFTRSYCYWTAPSGECLHRTALVNGFIEITQNNNKTQLLASNYGTF
jgi:hypothetical protein